MARRIDLYDDPVAPEANSSPSVNVVVINDGGDMLLIRRSDNQNWRCLEGPIDLGESMVQAGVRETKEETGVDCKITGLVGIYTDPKHVILYTSNGEVRQESSIVLTAPLAVCRRAVMRAARCGGWRGRILADIRWVDQ